MSRIIGYIDGYNLYIGLRDRNWRQFYWLDPHKLIESLAPRQGIVTSAKYFTARVKGPDDKRGRQTAFLDAINAISQSEVILGKFYSKPRRCRACNASWITYEEKMTDSAIASHLVADAFRDQFDTAYLIGGDTDIVPAIKMVRQWLPHKRLHVWFPPARTNNEVAAHCHDSGQINGDHFKRSQMPELVECNGVLIQRPSRWNGGRSAGP